LPLAPYFIPFSIRFSNRSRELVAVAQHHQRLRRRRTSSADVAIARQGPASRRRIWRNDRDEIDRRVGPLMRPQLDPRKREQVVDQPRHAPGLRLHDAEESVRAPPDRRAPGLATYR
jgi:hypothetical protein